LQSLIGSMRTRGVALSRALRVALIGAVAAFSVFGSVPVWACSVPVFRWALERWAPDSYELVVFHRGALGDADQAILDELRTRAADMDAPANLTVRSVDLDAEPDEHLAALWEAQVEVVLPWAVLRYPRDVRGGEHDPTGAWAGPWSLLSPEVLLDSPKRREVAEHILDGDCAVWVLLESGDAAKDAAAAKRLAGQLEEMTKLLRLPDMAGDPVLAGAYAPDVSDLRIGFSMLRVSRDDPAEAMFVRMLLGSESDLVTFDEPMAFPVYGRGRVLYAFVGAGINSDTIGSACSFLVNGCSCEIKAQNPGIDLLMAVDWESEVSGFDLIKEIELPPLPGIASIAVDSGLGFTETSPVHETAAVTPPPVAVGSAERTVWTALLLNILLAVGAVLSIVVVATLVVFRKRAP